MASAARASEWEESVREIASSGENLASKFQLATGRGAMVRKRVLTTNQLVLYNPRLYTPTTASTTTTKLGVTIRKTRGGTSAVTIVPCGRKE